MNYEELTIDDLEEMDDEDAYLEIASDPNAPEEFINYLIYEKVVYYVDLGDALANNPSLSDSQLGSLLRQLDAGSSTIQTVIQHPNFGENSIEEILGDVGSVEDAEYIDRYLKVELIETGLLQKFYIDLFSQDPSVEVRRAVAKSPLLDDTIVNNLIQVDREYPSNDYTGSVYRALASNPNLNTLSMETIRELFKEDNDDLDRALLYGEGTGEYLLYLMELRYMKDPKMLNIIREHPNYNPDFNNTEYSLNNLNEGDFWRKETKGVLKSKLNTDLELLKRLKGYLKNV